MINTNNTTHSAATPEGLSSLNLDFSNRFQHKFQAYFMPSEGDRALLIPRQWINALGNAAIVVAYTANPDKDSISNIIRIQPADDNLITALRPHFGRHANYECLCAQIINREMHGVFDLVQRHFSPGAELILAGCWDYFEIIRSKDYDHSAEKAVRDGLFNLVE